MPKRITLFFLSAVVALLLAPLVRPAYAQDNQAPEVNIEEIEIRGSRRIPKESILYYVQSKIGERYNETQARRDLEAIVNLGFFDPLRSRVLTVDGPRGGKILIFEVKEYPIIRDLQYRGLKSATESEILTRFKEKRVGVSKESQFDPSKANAARVNIRDLLAEKGYPDAEVGIEVEEISATAVALIFNIKEGPRVRVKEISFTGLGDKFSQRRLRAAMKYVKEAGLISTFTSKDVYFRDKLLADLEHVRLYLGSQGYLQAKLGEPQVAREGKVKVGIPLIPLLQKEGPGLKIVVPVEVGRRYKITKVEEKGVTLFQPGVVTAVTGLRVGDIASAEKIQKGVYENVKNIYGDRGYIEASADLEPKFIDKTETEGDVEFTIQVDEGKQFTMRRLEFIGNTNTRDTVLRREVILNEGDPYSKRYWDLSILRLNQLGLFDEIKEKDAITRTNPRDQTVDIDLQVKEKGRQQIQLNGGVSGYAGSFFGVSYSTNNLLGYGETLSLDLQGGNRQLLASIGFTEPYLLGKPISLGVSLFAQKYQFIGSGFNFNNAQQLLQASFFGLSSINADTLFTQRTVGGSISTSAPLAVFTRKFERYSRFTRVGLSYSLSATSVQDPKVNRDADPTNDIPVTFSQPRILTSRVSPYLSYNTLNSGLDPTRGQSITATFSLAGGPLGGDVKVFSPSLEYKLFFPAFRRRTDKPHVVGMRFLGAHARSFGQPLDIKSLSYVGGVPIFERFFLGGEYDIRGYNIRSISPVVKVDSFLSTRGTITPKVQDASGNLIAASPGIVSASTLRQFSFDAPENVQGGKQCAGLTAPDPSRGCNTVLGRTFYTPVGGDTELLYNLEYRVPVFSEKFQAVAFADVGTVFNARKYSDQLLLTNYINQTITPRGLIINPAGRVATQAEIQSAQVPGATPSASGLPAGFTQVYLTGESRSYDVVRLSQEPIKFLSDVRSSLGLEFRVQVPVINVPFRLIFYYNPNVKTDITDPRVLFLERRSGMRFSVGRTF